MCIRDRSLLTAWKRYHRRRSGGGREAAGKERAQGFEDGGLSLIHIVPVEDGQMQVLPHHEDMIAALSLIHI